MADILQWVLPIMGLTGTYIVGKKNVWGWLLQLGGQVLWAVFIIAIDKPGLLIGTLFYAGMYAWNFRKWLREERHADAQQSSAPGEGGSATAAPDVPELG